MKNKKLIIFVLFGLLIKLDSIEAQTLQPKINKSQKGENLLDFEAEVIEGEKKRPELFMDIKAGDGSVGSGLFMRTNYDDFFVVDKKRRPKFIKSK